MGTVTLSSIQAPTPQLPRIVASLAQQLQHVIREFAPESGWQYWRESAVPDDRRPVVNFGRVPRDKDDRKCDEVVGFAPIPMDKIHRVLEIRCIGKFLNNLKCVPESCEKSVSTYLVLGANS